MKTMRLLLASLLLLSLGGLAQSQTLDFTLSASSSDGSTVVPKLTWATTPAAASCTASGDVAWAPGGSASKPVSGTVTLPATSTSKSYVLLCNWPGVTKAVVSWTPPTTNTDGSAYTDPNGFRIQYGQAGNEAALTTSTYLTPAQSVGNTWTSPVLAAGTWFFGVKAVNLMGIESSISNIVAKTLTPAVNQTRTLGLSIKVPSPPVVE